jgi:hypothetical protein
MYNGDMINKMSNDNYSVELMQDPYNKRYLACFSGFDSKEIPDGYTFEEIDDMIDFLYRVQTELKFKSNFANTPSLYEPPY